MATVSPQITVIVPVYNASAYLGACIESILAQRFSDYELILINDGSLDGSGVICNTYAERDARIRVTHTENRGVSATRNLGLDQANGEWIAFVDADDIAEPDYLANLLRGAEQAAAGFRVSVISGTMIVSRKTNINRSEIRFDNRVVDKIDIPKAYLNYALYRWGYPFSKLYSRRLIEQGSIRFIEDIRYSEDMLFFLEYLLLVDRLVLLDDCDYRYYVSIGSGLSKSYSTFESEIKSFNIFTTLSNKVLGEIPKNGGLIKKEVSLLKRSISCLYRPGMKRKRADRVAALANAAEYCAVVSNMRGLTGYLINRGYYGLFDYLYNILYGLRYAWGGHFWRLICLIRWAKPR